MFISRYPSRISLAGGSTDQERFLDKYKRGMVINFSANVFNTIIVNKDKLGKNSYDGKHLVLYSRREETSDVLSINNDVVRHSLLENDFTEKITTVFFSDISSVGSGLACSSAYTLAFNRILEKLKGECLSPIERCMRSYRIEKLFNPFLGMQDTFGCGIGGLKLLLFEKDCVPKVEMIKTRVFEELDMYLLFSGITRNSTDVLKSLEFPNDSLLKICEDFHNVLISNDVGRFLELIKKGWLNKKNTSVNILESNELKGLDKALEDDGDVLAHRLCGAGNGGYFLLFTRKNVIPQYKHIIKVEATEEFESLVEL